jgi:hypothetical protein
MRKRVGKQTEDLEVPALRQLKRRPSLSLVLTTVSRAAGVRRAAIERPAPGRVRLARVAAVTLPALWQGRIFAPCSIGASAPRLSASPVK